MASFLKKLIDNAPVVGPAVLAGNQLVHGNIPSLTNLMDINPMFQGARLGMNLENRIQDIGRGSPAPSAASSTTGINSDPLNRDTSNVTSATTTKSSSSTTTPAGGANRQTAWDTSPIYAVVSQLTTKDYDATFKSGDKNTILKTATQTVLAKLKEQGYNMSAAGQQAFLDHAAATSADWVNQRKAAGQSRDGTSYFMMLTSEALQYAGEPGTQGYAPSMSNFTNNSTTTPQGQAQAQATADATAAATQKEGWSPPQTMPVDPVTGKSYGTGSMKIVNKDTYKPAVWGEGKWGDPNQGMYGIITSSGQSMAELYNSWAKDLVNQYGNTYDVSPESFDQFYGMSDYVKDHPVQP